MKVRIFYLNLFTVILLFLSACGNVPEAMNSGESAEETPVVAINEETSCYFGPGLEHEVAYSLHTDEYYKVIGIDDDVTWIDDDVTWIQINPNAVVDPDPPHKPIDELSPQPDPPGSVKVARCWVISDKVKIIGNLLNAPIIEKPILWTTRKTNCYSGPSKIFEVVKSLDIEQYFNITGIDDDITWIDDDVTWTDDGIGWFQINPFAIIDPEPPGKPRNAQSTPTSLSPAEMVVRCWVSWDDVRYRGDLTRLPVLPLASFSPPPEPLTSEPGSNPPGAQPPSSPPTIDCGSNTTYLSCMQQSNFGCSWDPQTSKCINK
jgi:hypothetical protein